MVSWNRFEDRFYGVLSKGLPGSQRARRDSGLTHARGREGWSLPFGWSSPVASAHRPLPTQVPAGSVQRRRARSENEIKTLRSHDRSFTQGVLMERDEGTTVERLAGLLEPWQIDWEPRYQVWRYYRRAKRTGL